MLGSSFTLGSSFMLGAFVSFGLSECVIDGLAGHLSKSQPYGDDQGFFPFFCFSQPRENRS